jgi:hypothetical protein
MAKKTEAKRSYKLDIMTVLEAADKGVKEFYTNLTEEEQKAFSPRVLIRWLSTVSDKSAHKEYAILATNDLVNLGMWSLSKHPELIWLLMTVAGTGKKQYHQWIPMSKGTSSTPKLDQLITQVWPHTNGQEQQMLKNLRSSLEWQELAKDLGWDDKQIKDLVNDLKKISR